MKHRFPLLLGAVVTIATAAAVLTTCGKSGGSQFQTTTLTRGPITQTVTATGTLNPVVNVQVGSQISGNIQKLFVDFNSTVKAGQVVAQIDPAVFQATVTRSS